MTIMSGESMKEKLAIKVVQCGLKAIDVVIKTTVDEVFKVISGVV